MTAMFPLTTVLLQAGAVPDTIVTRVVRDRDMFGYANGVLEIIVLVMGVAVLVAVFMLLMSLRKVIAKAESTFEKLAGEARPILKHASEIASDARDTVAHIKDDVDRVTDAAAAISDQLLDAADITAQRLDEVNAVLDVVQDEIERVAISSVAAVRGVRVGATGVVSALAGGNGEERSRPPRRRVPRVRHDALERDTREHAALEAARRDADDARDSRDSRDTRDADRTDTQRDGDVSG